MALQLLGVSFAIAFLYGCTPGESGEPGGCIHGFPILNCSPLTKLGCLAALGCNFDGGCVEKGCETFATPQDCSSQGSTCGWSAIDPDSGACRPTEIGDCGQLLDADSCTTDSRCLWALGCGGQPVDCDDIHDFETCEAAVQCYWRSYPE